MPFVASTLPPGFEILPDEAEAAPPRASFDQAYAFMRDMEGGYSDSKSDRGGATQFGISSKSWPKEFATVKSLVDAGRADEAEAFTRDFYKRNFWDPIGGDSLPPQLATIVFDSAVNHGPGTAKDLRQRSGDDPVQFLRERENYYRSIAANDPTQKANLQGWLNRNQRLAATLQPAPASSPAEYEIASAGQGMPVTAAAQLPEGFEIVQEQPAMAGLPEGFEIVSEPTSGIMAGMADRALDLGKNLVSGIGNIAETAGDYLESKVPLGQIVWDEQGLRHVPHTPESIQQEQVRPYFEQAAGAVQDVQKDINYQPSVSWESVKQDPLDLPNTGRFILEQGTRSIPDMAAVLTPGALPGYLASRTNEIAEERAANDGRGMVEGKDLLTAAPVAAVVTGAERFGARGLLPTGTVAKTATGRIAKAGAKEAGTEYVEESTEYAGETVGTKKGFDPAVMADRGLQGAVVGGPVGVAGRSVSEGVTAIAGRGQAAPAAQPAQEAPQAAQEAPKPEVPPVATPEPQPAPAATPEPVAATPEAPAPQKLTTPNNSMEVEADTEVVELGSLKTSDMPDYPANRQPRDRTSKRSEAQITEIVNNFDPERLGDSRTTDQGAPIIGPEADNIVESGNGRVMALRRVYETPEVAQRYREFLAKQGAKTDGLNQPVLVRRRKTQLDDAGLSKFVEDSNRDSKMSQNETEIAAQDARRMTPEIIKLFRGGSLSAEGNQQFRNRIIKEVIGSEAEAAGVRDAKGNLSQAGERRIRAAIFHYAYQDSQAVENFFTSSEPDLKSIGDVMQDVAPGFAEVRANIQARGLDGKYDIAKHVTEALEIIRGRRANGSSMSEFLGQTQMFGEREVNPVTERIVRGLFDKSLSRIASKKAIDTFLRGYADKVRNYDPKQGDILGENALPEPAKILDDLLKARDGRTEEPVQGTLAGTTKPSVKPKKRQLVDASMPIEAEEDLDSEPELGFEEEEITTDKGSRPFGSKTGSDFYFTNRQSIFRSMFRDAGHDPEKIASQPQRQLKIAVDLFKSKYGIDVEIEPKLQAQLAIDQLLDLYRNLQWQAHILQLPESALGLKLAGKEGAADTNIKLVLKKNAPYLGAWSNKMRQLMMPARTNSFAHEWGHALDYAILSKLDVKNAHRGFSAAVKKATKDLSFEPGSVEEAFLNVVNHLYGDGTLDILELSKLEQELAGLTGALKRGEAFGKKLTPAQMKEIKDKETAIAAKVAEIKKKHSKYFQDAKGIPARDDYWYRPTEMLARAFEAYVAHKVASAGGNLEAITMDNEAYAEFEKLYPQAAERIRIFTAYERLMDTIRATDILGTKDITPAAKPGRDLDMLDPQRITRLLPEGVEYKGFVDRLRNLAASELKEIQTQKGQIAEAKRQPADPLTRRAKARRQFKMTFSAVAEVARMYEKAYPQARAQLEELFNLITDRPGQAKAVGQTYLEQVDLDASKYHNEAARIYKKHGIETLSDKQNDMLRDLLLGKDIKGAPANLVKAAAALRNHVFIELWHYARNAGMDIGFIKDTGYLPREMNHAKIMTDGDGFIAAATKGYEIVFENEHGPIGGVDMEKFLKTMSAINQRRKIQGQGAPFSKNHEGVKALRKALKQIATTEAGMKSGKIEEDAGQAKLAELGEKIQEILDDGLYDEVKGEYADIRANDWLTRINGEEFYDFDRQSPNDDFTKHRSLPPEFDDIMKEYYVTNVRDLVAGYVTKAVSRANYVKRFDPKGGKGIQKRLDELAELGVDSRDLENIKHVVGYIAGRQSMSPFAKTLTPLLSRFHTLGTIVLLARASWASLSEPLVAGIQAADVRVGLDAYAKTIKAFAKTASMQDWMDLANHVGFVSDAMSEQHLASRIGGDFEHSATDKRVLSNFFRRTLLTHLTNASRIGVMASGNSYLRILARDARSEDAKRKAMAIDELARMGIPQSKAEDYAKWQADLAGRVPTIDDLNDGIGQLHKLALQRFMDRSIQASRKDKRPLASGTPVGRVVFAITGFLYSYWENVTKATVKRGFEVGQRHGKTAAAKYAAVGVFTPLAALWVGHTIAYTIRTALFNRERWEEWEKDGVLAQRLMAGGLSQLGLLGPADVIYNAILGLRWQRDLSGVAVGAQGGYVTQNLQRIAGLFINNSPNTNTAEHNAVKGAYNLIVAPLANFMLSAMPAGQATGFLAGVAMQYSSSGTMGDKVADFLVGEKGTKKKKGDGMDMDMDMKMDIK